MRRPKPRSFVGRLPVTLCLFALLAGLPACRNERKQDASRGLAPLAAPSWLVSVDVPGFGPALAAVPLGARAPQSLLIAVHGDHDRPEWTCGSYRHVVSSRAFILCPRGVAERDHFTLGSSEETAAELRKALPALKSRFKAYLQPGSVVLAGLGPSVDQVIELALQEPSFFSNLVLVNGSTQRFTLPGATRFGSAGGRRVLALCSAGACDADVEERLRALNPAGVATRVVRIEKGQGLDAAVVATLRAEFPWLVSTEPRVR